MLYRPSSKCPSNSSKPGQGRESFFLKCSRRMYLRSSTHQVLPWHGSIRARGEERAAEKANTSQRQNSKNV
eukprot:scaffold5525_cov242-Prasinococcus_capsulatus_cf.AAC.1